MCLSLRSLSTGLFSIALDQTVSVTLPVDLFWRAAPGHFWLASKSPDGGTPTAAALAMALDYFTQGDGSRLTGSKYVLLATDGGPNCNGAIDCGKTNCTSNMDRDCRIDVDGGPYDGNCCDPQYSPSNGRLTCLDDTATLSQVRALHDHGVRTFVVGIPGTEAYASVLDVLAVAGGVENPAPPHKYYAADAAAGVQGLGAVFSSITEALITTCRLQLSSVPPEPNRLNVQVDGVLIPRSGADGWSIDSSTSPPVVVLAGKTCERVENQGAKSAKVLYGCPTIP